MAKKKKTEKLIRWFDDLNNKDTAIVGGKNASLGEMISTLEAEGIRVPGGFATTADAYWRFLDDNNLREEIEQTLDDLDAQDPEDRKLSQAGRKIRKLILGGEFPEDLEAAIREAYEELAKREKEKKLKVAVRSSATAEDLPEASFAGQQESYLNISGADAVVEAVKKCFASLFTDRAIAYREKNGFDHMKVALSAGVQKMVNAENGAAGVMFTIDTETGFPDAIVINSAWGLGETVVGGQVNPDEFVVFKPLLDEKGVKPILSKTVGTKKKKAVYSSSKDEPIRVVETLKREQRALTLDDDEILKLARWGATIERHYKKAMDIEWARDEDGEIYIVQARPETVQSQKAKGAMVTYSLKQRSKPLAEGLAVGSAVASGKVRILKSPAEGDRFKKGEILVASVTDPDWGPIMERAAAIVTEHGGRTAHAAIVSRELSIPAIIGAEDALKKLKDGQEVTISCVESSDKGVVYEGCLEYSAEEVDLEKLPRPKTRIMLNIASPAAAFRWHKLPARGIGLARMEFIIGNFIKVHPMALLHYDELEDKEAKQTIRDLTEGYEDKPEYFVDQLSYGIARIAASQYPEPVIVRMSDFKTNEYAGLIGGAAFEPEEENPMLGFRGASRYYSEEYRPGFALECRAIRRVREEVGLDNVVVMIPFCRTVEEARKVIKVMKEEGLERGKKGLKVYVMAEIPSNILLAEEFSEIFDGFSIGSNDLTQLVLGVDRDSDILSDLFDERNESIKRMIRDLIKKAHKHKHKRPVGICGQAPSDYPDFAEFLVEAGIDSISLNPDSVVGVVKRLGKIEQKKKK